jgi:class 3 adenylate cyclase/predicted ATPase
MKFSDIVDQARALLQRTGKLTYRMLKREFALDDEALEDLKEQLITAEEVAVDKDGTMLVWRGEEAIATSKAGVQEPPSTSPTLHSPANYTPPHLAERIRAEQAALEAHGGMEGERKTITALFADIQDSTALIEDLDPEAARRIIDPALQLMMDAVHRYEGFVVQPTGDGIFALFGAPIAHEDHPQRALFAALLMQADSKRYAEQLRREQGLNLQIRVGVNAGEVVLRSIRKDDLHTDYTPVGHSIHLAARMESLASGGAVVVSEGTYKLIEGYFKCRALGEAKIKGVTEPVPIYEVLGVGPLRTRLQVAARRGLTRLVGRRDELEQLRRALEHAKAGHGQLVGVMGEPGLGKSRLFYEFTLTAPSGGLVLEAYSASYGKASPYLPVIELLKSYFQLQPHDEERQRKEKITGKVLTLDRSLEDTLPYLFSLLGIEDPTASLQQMDPQIRRRRTFEALKRVFLRESLNQPLILVFEDLHWIDSETQGFLDTLSESVASARILLLVNYRPEYRHEWGQKSYYTQLRLVPLGREEAVELLTELLGTDPSLTAVQPLILAKTEGTPFFLEEVVQTLAEEGVVVGDRGHYRLAKAPTELHISPTVQGVLAARIDRLVPEEKALLQQLAVIGREFPVRLLHQVIPQAEEELSRLLASLQRKEFLYEQPAFPESEYSFKHALTQEVAYGTVLHERRKALHERTAQAMEEVYRTNVEEHYSELAHHYSRSGNTKKAVEYLGLAGQQAVQRSAYAEAISHLTAALELLTTLPETPERSQQELALQLTLGVPLQILKGEAAPEVGQTYNRILTLCEQVGETAQFFPALFGLWRFYFMRPDTQKARELAEQMLRLAQNSHDPSLLLEAHRALGVNLMQLGELRQGQRHLEEGIALYDIHKHRSHAVLYGIDPGVYCLCFAGWNLWYLGYPEQALKSTQDGLHLAHELAHPFTLAFALSITALFHQFRQEAATVREQVEATLTLSAEYGFAYRAAWATLLQGWALATQGHREEGIVRIREGLAAQRATGAEINHPYFVALQAEVYGKIGQREAGLAALAEALALMQRTGGQWYEAELYRLQGQLTLQSQASLGQVKTSQDKSEDTGPRPLAPDPQGEAEAYFHKAVEIARKQQAKSWELRASTSLARLWQQQGKKDKARQMLAEIDGWFTEGFDTKDLQEAKALLAELGRTDAHV